MYFHYYISEWTTYWKMNIQLFKQSGNVSTKVHNLKCAKMASFSNTQETRMRTKTEESREKRFVVWMWVKTVGVLLRFCFRSVRLFELAGVEKMRWNHWLVIIIETVRSIFVRIVCHVSPSFIQYTASIAPFFVSILYATKQFDSCSINWCISF